MKYSARDGPAALVKRYLFKRRCQMMMLGMFLFLMFGFQEAPPLDFFFFF